MDSDRDDLEQADYDENLTDFHGDLHVDEGEDEEHEDHHEELMDLDEDSAVDHIENSMDFDRDNLQHGDYNGDGDPHVEIGEDRRDVSNHEKEY